MTNINKIVEWLTQKGYTTPGTQQANDLAHDLAQHLSTPTSGDTRNIKDQYKNIPTQQIKNDLTQTQTPLVSIFVNLAGDFNLSTGIRNSNWFNTHKVIIAGRRKWDRRGTVGTHHYTHVEYQPDILATLHTLREEGYRLVAAEITPTAKPLPSYEWEAHTAVIYGEEGAGLSQEILDTVNDIIFIPGNGSVRSLNVGTTHGIFTYDYHAKRGLL